MIRRKNFLYILFFLFPALSAAGADEPFEAVVKPFSELRVPIPVKRYQEEYLAIKPQPQYQLKESHIVFQDDLGLWSKQSESPMQHLYHLAQPFSSAEFVHIDGQLMPPRGNGSGEPISVFPFHVTVPAVDLDWSGPDAPPDEDREDTDVVWVNDRTNQTFVVRCPSESKDDMFRWSSAEKLPDMDLRWNGNILEVYETQGNNKILCASPHRISKNVWNHSGQTLGFSVSRKSSAVPDGTALPIRLERQPLPGDVNGNVTYDEIKCKIIAADLDIDTLPHWGDDYYTTDIRDPNLDAQEEEQSEWKGKIVFVNNIDKDGDEVPDYMDGWSCSTTQIPKLEREISGNRAINAAEKFVPLAVEIQPALLPGDDIRICFDYPASPPESMRREEENQYALVPQTNTYIIVDAPAEIVSSTEGKIRIWKKNGSEQRSVAEDFIESGKAYRLSELECEAGKEKLFYVEGINASQNWGDIPIRLKLSVDGGKTWIAEDCVRITSIMSNLGVCVVRQFYKNTFGSRKLFTPDYSSPSTFLDIYFNSYFETQKYHQINTDKCDFTWHDADASLGHGFAYVQYDGPTIHNMFTAPEFDHKTYWGKTGGEASVWTYGIARANHSKELLWWDICPYKIENKYLVLKHATTLHPLRLKTVNEKFFRNATREEMFGLHINPANFGWGCLSNVGLVLKESGISSKVENCYCDLEMPNIANKEIFQLLEDAKKNLSGKTKLEVIPGIMDAIVTAAQNTGWGATANTQTYNEFVEDLFDALEGEIINEVEITLKDQIKFLLQNTSDPTPKLQYYDPGLFPVQFGENPVDTIDLKKGN